MDSKIIEKVIKRFDFKGRVALLQFWQYVEAGDHWCLTLEGQPFVASANHQGLEEHRRWWFSYSQLWVRLGSEVNQEWSAGLAVHQGFAHQRTRRDPDQFWGLLDVPVYTYDDKLVGVIELATIKPRSDYAEEFNQIKKLLKKKNLATKRLIIEVEYDKKTIKFPLMSFGIKYLWEEVTKGFGRVNQQAFVIKYFDHMSGNYIRTISSDYDLNTCIARSTSLELKMSVEYY